MKKRFAPELAAFLAIAATWGADRITKSAAVAAIEGGASWRIGPFALDLHHNAGFALGSFTELPEMLRVVCVSTLAAFLVFCFVVAHLLIPRALLELRAGLGMLLGGILGNATDRLLTGRVIDFIRFDSAWLQNPIFNVADALQWVGLAIFLHALIRDGAKLWPDRNARKGYWINPAFQLRYTAKMTALSVSFALVTGTLSYSFFRVALQSAGMVPAAIEAACAAFLLSFGAVSAAFVIIVALVSVVFSHRIAGPIFAFRRFVRDLRAGKATRLKLRNADEFPELEELAEDLADLKRGGRRAG